ncbi:hypothetical protein OGAPHI_006241 [Ogataea philodendri]|uniref:Uncharacterized protein n=1 Tax=Ogataea philodendri TaxID=1378263 RepID=A0A9P8T1L3_9ASCO|nr:uncharacterized protein OGAPHI_006241 [Ogataea philodendri]KAH3662060.1 hypothetical protein OGAPHI_006241 [Ogataea philodendri]
MRPKHTPSIPPLPRLRVRTADKKGPGAGKCAVVMSQMLNCWAANGEGAAVCKELENQLRDCMHSKPFGFRNRCVRVCGAGQAIIDSVECAHGSQETENSRCNLTALVLAKCSNGIKQHEEPLAECQNKQRNGTLERCREQEEIKHRPCRQVDSQSIIVIAGVGIIILNTHDVGDNSTERSEESSVAKQQNGSKQVVINDSPDTGDDLDQTRSKEEATRKNSRVGDRIGLTQNQTEGEQCDTGKSQSGGTRCWVRSPLVRLLVVADSQQTSSWRIHHVLGASGNWSNGAGLLVVRLVVNCCFAVGYDFRHWNSLVID